MAPFDALGNVLLCTPKEKAERIWQRSGADVDIAGRACLRACRFSDDAGPLVKVLARETAPVNAKVREL